MRVTRFSAALLAGVLAVVGVCAMQVAPASATPNPPSADPALIGTWLNVSSAPRLIAKLTVIDAGAGAITVDPYVQCVPLCEVGTVAATVYGTNATRSTGRTFSVNEVVGYLRIVLLGTLSGRGILTVSTFVTYTSGDSKNFAATEKFTKSDVVDPTSTTGIAATDYPIGNPPAPTHGLLGTWLDPSGAFFTKMGVAVDPEGGLALAATTSCCDPGPAKGVVFGTNQVSAHGARFLAQFAGATDGPILIFAVYSKKTDTLAVTVYREFTDGSGRSNYTVHQTMTPA
jgi:hypothetical protein